MALSAGRLSHFVEIDELVSQLDSNGVLRQNWILWAQKVSAEVVPLSVRELIAAQAVNSQATARITLRYRPGLKASMRIRFRGQIFNIAGVLPDNVSGLEYVTLPVSQGVNNG